MCNQVINWVEASGWVRHYKSEKLKQGMQRREDADEALSDNWLFYWRGQIKKQYQKTRPRHMRKSGHGKGGQKKKAHICAHPARWEKMGAFFLE